MNGREIMRIENPVLKKGQCVFVHDNVDGGKDEQYIKIGDGKTPFNDLPYGIPESTGGASGGGADPIIFTYIDPLNITCNKTLEQVKDDYLNGNFICYAKRPGDEGLIEIHFLPSLAVLEEPFMFGATTVDGMTSFLYSAEGITYQGAD